jgi:ubiquinone/menaquinone biosynthesis C-methylase UbiE
MMNNFSAFDEDAVDKLVKKLRVTAKDADYIAPRDNLALQTFIFFIFIFSISAPIFIVGKDRNRIILAIDYFILFLTIIFFIYDYIRSKFILKRLYGRDIWLLKTLLTHKDVKRFYSMPSLARSQELFIKQNLSNWFRRIDLVSLVNPEIVDDFIKKIGIEDKVVANLGFGDRTSLETLAHYKNTVYGIELNMNSLKDAYSINPRLCQADVENIPFRSQSFDGVLFSEVLEHTTNPQGAISEIRRILKPGGLLLLTTPNRNSIPLNYFLNPLKLAVQFLGWRFESLLNPRPLIGIIHGYYYFHTAYSFRELKYLLEQANFRIRIWASYGIGGGIVSTLLMLRPSLRRILSRINDMESRNDTKGEIYSQLKALLVEYEKKYSKKLARFNVLLQKVPIINLIGTNHIIVAERT